MILSLGYHPLVHTIPDPGIVHLLDPRRAIDTVICLLHPLDTNQIGISIISSQRHQSGAPEAPRALWIVICHINFRFAELYFFNTLLLNDIVLFYFHDKL